MNSQKTRRVQNPFGLASLGVSLLVLFLFLSASYGWSGSHELRILHLNDFHGFAESYESFGSKERLGGMAHLASTVERLRSEKPTLLLAAGDMIQGNNWANLFRGASSIELMNLMRFDAMVLGNHEFDFGKRILQRRIREAHFPVLGSNVRGLDGIKGYAVLERGGLRIGILGVVTEDTPVSTSPKNVVGIEFLSAAETIARSLPELRKKADIVLVLSHLGYHQDRILAEKIKGIQVIVGGHSHTRLNKPTLVQDTLIVQAWEHGKALGVLDLTIEDGAILQWEGRLEEIRADQGEEDPRVKDLVHRFSHKISSVMNLRVGEAETDLDGQNVRRKETNLGNLIADVLREVSGSEVALINGGGIRTSIKQGEIRVKDIYSAIPFDNYIVSVILTGKQLKEALEHGFSGTEEHAGRFPQVSGMTVSYHPSASPGKRVREVKVQGLPLDPNREYRVATNDFIAAGGDGYKAFEEAIRLSKDLEIVGGMMKGERLAYSDAGRWIRDVVIEYIQSKKRVSPVAEGRIREVSEP